MSEFQVLQMSYFTIQCQVCLQRDVPPIRLPFPLPNTWQIVNVATFSVFSFCYSLEKEGILLLPNTQASWLGLHYWRLLLPLCFFPGPTAAHCWGFHTLLVDDGSLWTFPIPLATQCKATNNLLLSRKRKFWGQVWRNELGDEEREHPNQNMSPCIQMVVRTRLKQEKQAPN